ncbi:M16 family metallopeptidase [Segnochrobactraceae bacterium EtOH-i3]
MPLPRLVRPALAALLLLGTASFALAEAPVAPPLPPDIAALADTRIAPDARVFTLKNGLTLVVIPDHRAPVVTHMVWYKVGAADEPQGHSGIAHFLEHLMFKGTPENPDGAFSRKVAAVGGEENAFTSSDYTAYYQRVDKDHLEQMMHLEADRMANLVLTDEVILPERQVVLEERNERTDNNPSALLSEAKDASLFINHPYANPIIGWRPEMEKMSRDDAIAFYDRFYTPNNAIVVVAGDVDADVVQGMAVESYGQVKRRAEPPPRVRPEAMKLVAGRTLEHSDARVAEPTTQLVWLVPSERTEKVKGDSDALEILSEIVGGGPSSRIYGALVRDGGPATAAGAYYRGDAMDDTQFGLYARPRDGVTLPEIEAKLRAVLAEVAEKGPTQDELDRVKRALLAQAVYAQDSQSTLARIFGASLATGYSVPDVQTWPARIARVSAAQVQDAAKRLLSGDPDVTARLTPAVGADGKALPPAPSAPVSAGGAIR